MPQIAPLIGTIAVNLAIGVGASVLASVIAPKQNSQTLTTEKGFSFELQTGEAVRVSAVLGQGRAAGQLMYHNSYGTDNEFLQIVIKAGHGWHDSHKALLIDEKPVTLNGSNDDPMGFAVGEFTVDGTPYMWAKFYTGAPGQAADPELVAQANPSDRWTDAHTMTGCAYYILTCRYDADLYGSTIPLSGSVWNGVKMFDWRDPDCVWGDQATYVATCNPVVIRYNFRRGIFVNGVRILGQGFSGWACDLPGYTAAANRCEEDFFDPETETTFPVFAFGREVGDDESKLDVLAEIDASYAGTSFKRGGADVPLPAQRLVSVLTLTNADRLAGYPVQADRKGAVSSKRTMWHGQFVSEESAYALAPYTPRIDVTLETLIGGRRSVPLDQPFEWLQPRAQLRAEIALRRQIYAATRVETFTPKAFVLEPGDPLVRACEWGNLLMVVQKTSRVLKDGRLVGVTVTMSQWSNEIVPASGDSFVTQPAGPGTAPADAARTLAVSGGSIVPYSREGGGAVHPYGKASWTAITDPNVDQVLIRLWPSDGTEAADKEDFLTDSRLSSTKLVGPLQPLTAYTYKFLPIRKDGRTTVWSNTATFTSGAETTPAEVADGSITPAMLGQQLLNDRGILNASFPGSVPDQLDELRAAVGDLAIAITTGDETHAKRISTLIRQTASSRASIIRTEEAVVEESAARATAIEELTASVGDLLADGYLKLETVVDEDTATATITAKVQAVSVDAVSQAGWVLRAEISGTGSPAYFGVLGAFYVWSDLSSDPLPAFEVDGDGKVKFRGARAGRITSADETSMIIDFDDPEIYMES